jgi:hypothetical protein
MIRKEGPKKWIVTASNKDRYGKQTRRRVTVHGSEAKANRVKKYIDEELAAIKLGFEYCHVKYGDFLEKEFFPYVDQTSPAEYDGLTKSMSKWCTCFTHTRIEVKRKPSFLLIQLCCWMTTTKIK